MIVYTSCFSECPFPLYYLNLIRSAGSLGIDPTRLVFASPLPKAKHLARLKLADIALDTLTVNGHTTTADALLAGVPVITCLGRHFASRVAASILSAIRMPDLVAPDMESYVQIAITLASDARLLASGELILIFSWRFKNAYHTQHHFLLL